MMTSFLSQIMCFLQFQVIQGSGTIACSANLGKADSHELCGHIMTGRTKRGVSAHPDFWSFTQGHYVNENGTTHWMMKGAFVQLASTTGNVKPGAAVHYSLAVTNNTSGHTLWDSYQLHNAMVRFLVRPRLNV